MSEIEHAILGDLFLVCAVSLFILAIPAYAIIRRKRPAEGWHRRGRVPTTALGAVDLLGIGIFFGFYSFFWMAIPAAEERELTAFGILDSIFFHGLCGGIVIGMLVWRTRLVEFLGLRWRNWPLVFAMVPCVVVVMWIFNGSLMWAGYFEAMQHLFGENPMQESVRALQDNDDPLTLVLLVAAACIVAPLAEELVFRGYIYPSVKRFTDPVFATLFTSLFFAVVHLNAASVLPLFVLAILLTVVYEMSGSLWAPIAVHFGFNAVTVVVNFVMRFVSPETLKALES
ncbi:MAG: CPBP family intramembrane metalloprotease [Akkermansiaceae bacterium]|nr:CPBP family intramembrane metalloprotease [Akkermansiaceae bacterium]